MVGNCTKGDWGWQWEDGQPTIHSNEPSDLLKQNQLVAIVYPRQRRELAFNYLRDEMEANANLMVASKDLYSELIGADETICELCKRLNPQHEDCTSCQDREARLKAIHKAAGKDD